MRAPGRRDCMTIGVGSLDVVRPVVDAYPGAIGCVGPHRIPLLRHAVAGDSDEVVDFLRSMGAV